MLDVRHAFARRTLTARVARAGAAALCLGGAVMLAGRSEARSTVGGTALGGVPTLATAVRTPPSYRGVLTFATPGSGDPFGPAVVQELDLASNDMTVRFDGVDPTRARSGETAFITRLVSGYLADHGIVVADGRGVPGAPVHVCKDFNWSSNASCSAPKLAPNGRLVAFGTRGSGTVCKDNFGVRWGDFVIVTDRRGGEVARFEGYTRPEWLPDGRLLMLGTMCRNAGVWSADATLRTVSRIDGDQVATPATAPAVSPDGRRLAFVWNKQLWSLGLDGRPELTQLTRLPKAVASAAWSPDGTSLALLLFDVSMPVKSVVLLRPGDESSLVVRPLPVYPYGPLSWR